MRENKDSRLYSLVYGKPCAINVDPIEKKTFFHFYNTNAYDSVKILKLLDGVIDIYMPDAKYSNDKIAVKYSAAPNYFEIMKSAIKEMHRQVGDLKIDKERVTARCLLVRHLVLPENLADTKEIVEFLAKEISQNTFINIMDQYRPCYGVYQEQSLSRPITQEEYLKALDFAH